MLLKSSTSSGPIIGVAILDTAENDNRLALPSREPEPPNLLPIDTGGDVAALLLSMFSSIGQTELSTHMNAIAGEYSSTSSSALYGGGGDDIEGGCAIITTAPVLTTANV